MRCGTRGGGDRGVGSPLWEPHPTFCSGVPGGGWWRARTRGVCSVGTAGGAHRGWRCADGERFVQNLTLDEASATPSLSKQVDVTYALYDSPVLSSRFKGVIYSKPPAPPNFISLASEENLVSPRRYAPLPCPPVLPRRPPTYLLSLQICLFWTFRGSGVITAYGHCTFSVASCFETHPCCSFIETSFLFCCRIIFHCTALRHFISPFVNLSLGVWGRFHCVANTNDAAVTTCERVFVWTCVLISPKQISRSGIAGSNGVLRLTF